MIRTLFHRTRPPESNLLVKSILVQGASDIGRVRRRNEDSFALSAEHGLAVVADGMGGHPGGDIASQVAARTALETLVDAIGDGNEATFREHATTHMERAIISAHGSIRSRGEAEPRLDGMGTTLTVMVAQRDGGHWAIGHVGDSRVYLFRDGVLVQLTRDDTWVQQQIDNEIMKPEQARRSAYAHLLTQCVGLEETPTPQVLTGEGQPGDCYLLCTDGLVGMLSDEEITRMLAADAPGESILAQLLEAANDAGGHDNITAALVYMA